MLPDPHYHPVGDLELAIGIAIAALVRGDLVLPVGTVRSWLGGVDGTTVPEAAIDEHSDLRRPEHDVDTPALVGQYWPVYAKSQTATMELASQRYLRRSVAGTSARHPRAHGRG